MHFKSHNFKIVQDWIGLDNFETSRLMDYIQEVADENNIDLDEATTNQTRNLADAAYRRMQEDAL